MRRIVCWAGLLALSVGAAWPASAQQMTRQGGTAAPRPKGAAAPTPPGGAPHPGALERMDSLLQLWAEQSSKTETLDAEFTRVDVNKVWGIETKYEGRALLVAPDKAFLSTAKAASKAGQPAEFHERIVATGQEVYHYVGATKQIFIYPIDRQDRKRALEEGPLPFLFNMSVAKAKERYQMHLIGENEKYYQVRIVPKLKIDRDSFLMAEILLNKKTFLPERLVLTEPNGKDTQTYAFGAIQRNKEVNPENFEFRKLKGWTVTDNRGGGQVTPGPAANPDAPAARPAQQPAVGRRGVGGRLRGSPPAGVRQE